MVRCRRRPKDLEEAVLGAVMLEKGAFDAVVEILKPECFYVDAHQRFTGPCRAGQ
jgi:replicative DNA helicase